jgi:hypothetical protein
LYSVPLQTVVPRAIWTSKPEENIGQWFTQTVWGYPYRASIAMTPFGFLYFAGGIILIVPFFFLFGIMQKALFYFLKLGTGGIIIFIGLLLSIVLIDSTVNGIFVSWIRNYPILILFQYIILKR